MRITITTATFGPVTFPVEFEITKNPFGRRLTPTEVIELFSSSDPVGVIAGVECIGPEALDAAKNLRIISRCGVGTDAIDLDACRQRGIIVLTTPDAPVSSVAEHTITLILGLLKRLIAADRLVKSGAWTKPESLLLEDRIVGVIGCGRIGTRVSSIVTAFGAGVIGYDPFLDSHESIQLVDLDFLIRNADIVSLHLPLTGATRHLIDSHTLGNMKPDAILINTSRGDIVDEAALADALVHDRIRGAALDVFTSEPYTGPLCNAADRVILTPHMASSTREGRAEMERRAAQNLYEALVPDVRPMAGGYNKYNFP